MVKIPGYIRIDSDDPDAMTWTEWFHSADYALMTKEMWSQMAERMLHNLLAEYWWVYVVDSPMFGWGSKSFIRHLKRGEEILPPAENGWQRWSVWYK